MGEKMVQRHTELGRRLRELSRSDLGSPPLSTDRQATLARLTSLPERDFDASFKSTVDAIHGEELAMYRQEASQAVDPRLGTLVTTRVTALEKSLASTPAPSVTPAGSGW